MKSLFFTFTQLLLLISCAQSIDRKRIIATKKPINRTNIKIKIENKTSHPGFALKIENHLSDDVGDLQYVCKLFKNKTNVLNRSIASTLGEQIHLEHLSSNGKILAFLGIPYKTQAKSIGCWLEIISGGEVSYHPTHHIDIVKYPYKEEFLKVSKKHVDLSAKNLKRWQEEMKIQKEIYSNSSSTPYFNSPFNLPLKSKITSHYGKRRVFNNKKDSWHSGTDFRAPSGTPIPVANRGRVVYAGDLFFNGKTIIVDHGIGIFTMYCHLSKHLAVVGDLVNQGDIIGKAGSTGRSTAPHLHWGTKVSGQWIQGHSLASIKL